MIGTWAGWIAILPAKPSRRLPRIRGGSHRIPEIDIDGVDRRHGGGGGAGKAQHAGQAIGIEKIALFVAIGLRADVGGQILGAPGEPDQAGAGAGKSAGNEQRGGSLGGDGEDFDMAVRQAVLRLAHGELGVGVNDRRATFGLR